MCCSLKLSFPLETAGYRLPLHACAQDAHKMNAKCINVWTNLSLCCSAEWRIPHLYPVLHQLPTVSWHSVCVYVWDSFTVSVCCTKPIFSLSLLCHLDLTSTYRLPSISHGSFVDQSMLYLFFPFPDKLTRSIETTTAGVKLSTGCCASGSLSTSLPASFLLAPFLLPPFFYLQPIDRVTAHTLTDGVLWLSPYHTEHC